VTLGSSTGFGSASGLSKTAEEVLGAVAPTLKPAPTPGANNLKVGSTVHFGIQGQDFAPAAGRYDYLISFITSVNANDVYGVAQHMSDYRVVLIRSGTAGIVLPSNDDEGTKARQVRVTEGPYSGTVMTVMWDWLY
jgi:hypothetical protein